ncbi:DUF5667 domain-containing protein [Bacillus sp. EB01]|uniref:DUF5667 domain-containing protein n=1 Tax=Bacillus sp. EB01 TaxID=1347086 RepID=UPI0012DC2461|nr:DUF5667 domain-containing protein [Bacillus sp. EB01]
MKKIVKVAMSMVLAGTFAFSPILAKANTGTENQDETQTLPVTSGEDVQALDDTDTPSLIPGDFFYFVKVALEKIKLAIAFNNDKEAELLAAYAAERLAEAEELFIAGEEERAIETIKEALTYLEEYEEQAGEEAEQPEFEKPEDDGLETDEPAEGEQSPPGEQPVGEEPANEVTEGEKETSDVPRQNIVALMAALEKVQNPKAKAALQKNIDKTYEKIAEKLAKIEEDSAKDSEQAELEEGVTPVKPVIPSQTSESGDVEDDVVGEKNPVITVPADPAKKDAKQAEKVEKKKAINEKKQAKEIKKQEKKEAKAAQQKEKKETKATQKKEKQVQKEARKQDKKEQKGKSKEQKNNGK